MTDKLNEYLAQHCSPEHPILQQLNRETHLKILRPRMLSGHLQGTWLYMMTQMIRPKRILELGTYTGYSAISMGLALPPDGELISIDQNDELKDFAQDFVNKAGLTDQIRLLSGDALSLIPQQTGVFDLVFIDAEKSEYLDYYHLVFDLLPSGGILIADNVLWDNKVLYTLPEQDPQTQGIIAFNEFVQQDARVENIIMPLRDGLMVVRKI